MASDVQGTVREILISALENAGKSSNGAADKAGNGSGKGRSGGKAALAAAGVGAAALVPVAVKGVGKLAQELGLDTLEVIRSPEKAVEGLKSNLGEKVSSKVDEAGGPAGILKDTVKSALPGGGGGGTKGGATGVGKGRRMPVQQSIDIGVPLESVYNQWTQFELWPEFMHRVTRASQEDDCTVSFAAKIWGKTKEFTAHIETQRPDQRIQWKVTDGMIHTGVVTFHELGPQLTRVLLGFDVEPGSLLEKASRGMRHVKRAARGDLHRFKAFIEMQETETGAWRGEIQDGEVVKEHDPKYDKSRDYSDPEQTLEQSQEDEDEDQEESRGGRQASRQRSSSRGSSRSSGSSSRSGGGSSGGSSRGRTRAASKSTSSRRSSGSSSSGKSRSSGRSTASGSSRRSSGNRRGSGSGRSSGTKTRSRQTKSRSKS